MTQGEALSHYDSAEVLHISYEVGDASFYQHSEYGDFVHDLKNIGNTKLVFSTLEFKSSYA